MDTGPRASLAVIIVHSNLTGQDNDASFTFSYHSLITTRHFSVPVNTREVSYKQYHIASTKSHTNPSDYHSVVYEEMQPLYH